MKKFLFSLAAVAALLATAPVFAATPAQGRPNDRGNNYGYAKDHKVSPEERKRWEDQHKGDRKDDDHKKNDYKKNDHKNDRRDDNYGYAKDHKVSPQERKRWEDQHKNDHQGDRH